MKQRAKLTRIIEAYKKESDSIALQIPIEINVGVLRSIFNVSSDDPMYDVWSIKEEQAKALQPFVPTKLDLSKYDYQLVAVRES